MIKHPSQRVAVLIDVQNLYYSARNLYNAKVNFGNIVKDAVGERMLTRALAYVVKTKTGEERPFFEALEKLGIETKEKDLQIFFGGAKKGDWDIGMAIDAIVLAEKVDSIVLATGDGDFEPLVQYLKITKGIYVEIVAFRETASSKIIGVADAFMDLSADKSRFLITGKNEPAERKMIPVKKSDSIETPKNRPHSAPPPPKATAGHGELSRVRRARPRIPLSSLK